eukprot:scaffold5611_cov48-Phaeocystis_antarctica.AAC.5
MRAVASKAEVPFHAQRMSSLLASDKEFAFCRVARRAYSEVRFAGWEAGGRQAIAVHVACRGGAAIADWGQGTGRSARGTCSVEAQRLVERRRALPGLPRVERGAYGAVGGVALEAGGGGRPRCKQGAGRARLQIGGRAR